MLLNGNRKHKIGQNLFAALAVLPLAACSDGSGGSGSSGSSGSTENTPDRLPSFCAEIPRPGWAAYEKQDSSNEWFHVYRLNDDLYAITEPFQWQEVINYLIIGTEKALLFDTGNGLGDIKAVVDQITDLPITVLASHSHIDHVGGHWQFDTILAPDTDFTNNRAQGKNNDFVSEEASSIALCKPLPDDVSEDNHHIKPFTPSARVADGSEINLGRLSLEVLAIPGHTPDALGLLDRKNGRLFTGDSYYKGPIWLYAPETDLGAYRASIARLAALVPDLKAVHGAHNEPFSNPEELLKVRDGFEAVYTGAKQPDTLTETQAQYDFGSFSLIMQANHEALP